MHPQSYVTIATKLVPAARARDRVWMAVIECQSASRQLGRVNASSRVLSRTTDDAENR